MRTLAVDTATEVCGIGLSVDGRPQLELIIDQGVTHTKVLMEGVRSILALAQWELSDLNALAVVRGPGSFTGLRIGISTMKGLASALDKPLVGISSLEVLAHQAPEGYPLVCPMIDARRKEVYWSLYRRSEDGLEHAYAEQAGRAAYAADRVDAPCLFIGNGAMLYASLIRERRQDAAFMAEAALNAIRPGLVATLASNRIAEGFREEIDQFGPVYLRKSDAELGRQADSP